MGTSDSSDSTQSQQIRPLQIHSGGPPAPIDQGDVLIGACVAERFRVVDLLGTGGMGAVYGVVDERSGEELALKLLRRTVLSKENRRRFRREISAAVRVRHRHLVRVVAHGTHHNSPFLVMERLKGETLQARLARVGALPVVDCVVITLQLLDALHAVHLSGFLHRDVKPSNVFLCDTTSEHDIRLIDFGLARALPRWQRPEGDEENTGLTATGVIPGTPAYLAPEQVVGAELDERVDVWAAGLTLHEMLCGNRVFRTREFTELVKDIMYKEVPPPPTQLPDNFNALLRQALARNRQDRFASALAFRTALVAVWARYRALGLSPQAR